ncbi:probable Ufm1-specific protease 1 [Condylostylus longicornis]|uniref:probable Ufm1-specific protease 1 n=1 Tax=Condylostylus longicornis TaxID=2530218 RepID=UPI00244DD642|nr:probable Ufm1-specific protease 1 [Condylostylus longicornis]
MEAETRPHNSQRVGSTKNQYCYPLLKNVHLSIPPPTVNGKTSFTYGDFTYYHYKCDLFDDVGWGCAYRTLQSACSWIRNILIKKRSIDDKIDMDNNKQELKAQSVPDVPTIPEIQKVLVNISDKPESFFGSKEWIGALEVFFVIDTTYDVCCKILHIPENDDIKKYANIIWKYFEEFGGLIMMGGDVDASSKGIAGCHISDNQAYFLVIDPHFVGKPKSIQELIEKGYVRWQHTSEFIDSSFYNLCLPQISAKIF